MESVGDRILTKANAIKEQLDEVFKITPETKVLLSLNKAIQDSFKCRSVMVPPVIFAKCYCLIIGCSTCIKAWYSGTEALIKSCINCGMQRGYAETMQMAGLNEFFEAIQPIFNDDSELMLDDPLRE